MALKCELIRQTGETLFIEKRIVKLRFAHPVKVEQKNATVEPCQAIWWRFSDTTTRVLITIFPERVSIHRLQVTSNANDIFAGEQLKAIVKFVDVIHEFEISVQHDDPMHGFWQDSVDGDGKEEQGMTVVGTFLRTEVFLHWLYDLVQIFS